jgi:hypothetical protein
MEQRLITPAASECIFFSKVDGFVPGAHAVKLRVACDASPLFLYFAQHHAALKLLIEEGTI